MICEEEMKKISSKYREGEIGEKEEEKGTERRG